MKSSFLNNVLMALTLVLITVVAASAQPGNGGGQITITPIDGGASLLLAGGIAYGARKLRALRSKKA